MNTTHNLKKNFSDSVLYLTQRLRSNPAICLLIRSGTIDLNYIGAIHQRIPITDVPHCNYIPQSQDCSFFEATIEGIPVLLYENPYSEVDITSFFQELYPLHIIANLGIRCLITIDQIEFFPSVTNHDILIINDHINHTGINAVKSLEYEDDFTEKMKKFSIEYSESLVRICETAFEKLQTEYKKSVLLGVTSPSTLSKAEQSLYSSYKAECIGNIQVLEAIIARYYSLHICTFVVQKFSSTHVDSTLLNERRQHLYGIINFILPNIYQFLATTPNEIS